MGDAAGRLKYARVCIAHFHCGCSPCPESRVVVVENGKAGEVGRELLCKQYNSSSENGTSCEFRHLPSSRITSSSAREQYLTLVPSKTLVHSRATLKNSAVHGDVGSTCSGAWVGGFSQSESYLGRSRLLSRASRRRANAGSRRNGRTPLLVLISSYVPVYQRFSSFLIFLGNSVSSSEFATTSLAEHGSSSLSARIQANDRKWTRCHVQRSPTQQTVSPKARRPGLLPLVVFLLIILTLRFFLVFRFRLGNNCTIRDKGGNQLGSARSKLG